MQRTRVGQRGRATALSAGAHGTLLGALLFTGGGGGDSPTPPRAPVIRAELVTLAAVPTPMPATPAPEDRAPSTPEPAPPPLPPAATVTESPTESRAESPASDEAAGDEPLAPEPTAPSVPVAPSAPANESPERVAAEDAPAEPPPTSPTEAADAATVATTEAENATAPPGRPLASAHQQMLSQRLASWTGRLDPGEPAPTLRWREDGQVFTAVFTPLAAADAMGMERLAVEVSTELAGERLVTDLRMIRLAFSSFAQFVDRWDPDVQIHDDVIDGRFHSNSEIRVSRERGIRPVFQGKVTLAARDVRQDGIGWSSPRALFPAGLETGVRRIPLSSQAVTFGALDLPPTELQRFDYDAAVTFYADGSYGWHPLGDGATEQRRPIGERPHYLLGAADVELHVRGVVNGAVLVYTPGRIVIADDLLYAADPSSQGADDYLGLVAERSVEIGEPELTGPGDLEVHASIYARRQFAVRSYGSRPSGTLRIVGSLTAGSLTATEPRFATAIEFDERLATLRAPGFPLSDRYELEFSTDEWRRAP